MYPLVGGQWCYGWMTILQTLLIRNWGAGTPTPTMVRRGPSHHGLSTETAWRAQTLPPPSRSRAGVSIESRRWKSLRRAGSPALTSRTKGQKEHGSKSKLRPEERMGNYVQLRRTGIFSEWHPSHVRPLHHDLPVLGDPTWHGLVSLS